MKANFTGKQLRVAPLGLDQRFINSLQVFFDRQCKDRCLLVDHDTDFAIVDLDVFGSNDLLIQYQDLHQGHPLVVLSLKEIKTEIDKGIICLRKPFSMEQLYNAFQTAIELLEAQKVNFEKNALNIPSSANDKLRWEKALSGEINREHAVSKNNNRLFNAEYNLLQKKSRSQIINHETKTEKESTDTNPSDASIDVSSSPHSGQVVGQSDNDMLPATLSHAHQSDEIFIGSAPDISIEDVTQAYKTQYNPEKFLQGQLIRVCKLSKQKGKPMILKTRDESLIVTPEQDLVQTAISENRLRALSSIPVSSDNFSIKSIRKGEAVQMDGNSQLSLESVLWNSALYAARGRVPVGTDLMKPVSLKQWPNLTRVTLFPHALRIAALWAARPYSLSESVQLLGIPQRYVFSFYSAVSVLGLVQTDQSADLDERKPVKKSDKRSLLGRIIKHLQKNY